MLTTDSICVCVLRCSPSVQAEASGRPGGEPARVSSHHGQSLDVPRVHLPGRRAAGPAAGWVRGQRPPTRRPPPAPPPAGRGKGAPGAPAVAVSHSAHKIAPHKWGGCAGLAEAVVAEQAARPEHSADKHNTRKQGEVIQYSRYLFIRYHYSQRALSSAEPHTHLHGAECSVRAVGKPPVQLMPPHILRQGEGKRLGDLALIHAHTRAHIRA
jgi:hypothetical protein